MKISIRLIKTSLLFFVSILAMQMVHGQVTVTGIVIDAKTKRPIEDVSIIPSIGKSFISKTDRYGKYIISCDTSAFILFTCFMHEDTIVKVGRQTNINVAMCTGYNPVQYGGYYTGATGKPVIYLYPSTPTEVSLKVNYNGKMETTYPAYNGGWIVKAEPDGTLYNKADGKEYSYLFWDGIKQYTKAELSYNSGFVVAADTALEFLQRVLPQMGLTPREYNEFIVYWLPFLQKNKLNFVHFRVGDAYNVISQNEVSPAPDTEIRVFMEFQAINTVIKVAPQHFTNPTRKGFTLVEWGGTEIKDEINIAKINEISSR